MATAQFVMAGLLKHYFAGGNETLRRPSARA